MTSDRVRVRVRVRIRVSVPRPARNGIRRNGVEPLFYLVDTNFVIKALNCASRIFSQRIRDEIGINFTSENRCMYVIIMRWQAADGRPRGAASVRYRGIHDSLSCNLGFDRHT